MTTGHLDTTKYNTLVANAAAKTVISSQIFKDFIADVKDKNDSNYDTAQIQSFSRQSMINPGFAVNQRTVSGTVTLSAGQYGHDRWKAGSGGCTYTFSTVNNVTTITITAGSLVQVIEGINLYSGTYTLSWTGTAQGKIGAGAFGASGITGSVTGGTNLSIEFNAGTLSNVQFNFGSSVVPFQPRSFTEELSLCQRYYEKSFNYADAPADGISTGRISWRGVGGNFDSVVYPFKVHKRISTGTITFYNPNAANANKIYNSTAGTNIAVAWEVGDKHAIIFPSNVITAAGVVLITHFAIDAEL